MSIFKNFIPIAMSIIIYTIGISAQQGKDWVDGEIYQFAKDGSWCWFQDERAVIDTANNKLIVGTANMQSSVDLTIFDIETKKVESSKRGGRLQYADDHNSPGLLIAPNGNYIALWAHHYDSRHHYSIYSNGKWSNERSINWGSWGSVGDCKVAYSNLYYLSDEKRIYNFSRVFDRAPNFVYSDDNGEKWDYGGQLTTNSSNSYNKGYYKYWGNGKDRIDMVFTEEHPRDQKTSIYHGYIKDHKMYNTEGEVGDDDIYSKKVIPTFEKFTKVFKHGTEVNGAQMGRCWQHDICRYDDSTIVILFKARANDNYDDHRNFYARYNGEKWKITYLGKAGEHIYGNEHDYVGLGSVNPDDPNRIYLCTRFNPGDDKASPASKREIWRGTTEDDGETWEWEPVTANSSRDNFRPIVPKWKPGKEAVLWFRGNYQTAQKVYTEAVGTFYEYDPPTTVKMNTAQKNQQNTLTCTMNNGCISFQLHTYSQTPAQLNIYSLSGKVIAHCTGMTNGSEKQRLKWNTTTISAGTYLVRISVGTTTYMKRITVQR